MPKEKEDFRPIYETLRERFPGRDVISLPEAAKVVGMKSETYRADPTWPRFYTGKHAKVHLAALARRMS